MAVRGRNPRSVRRLIRTGGHASASTSSRTATPRRRDRPPRFGLGDPGSARLYYANVEERDGRLWTLRSRTLAFVGTGTTLEEAEDAAERAAAGVTGPVRHRRDIGTRALLEQRCAHMRTIR